ncbi:hypothetical protein ACLOJK_026397 [Asimina triloba]
MGPEKQGSRGAGGYVGGFFQLFDWNKKSRKKLSYNKFDLPEGVKQGKRSSVDLPSTQISVIEDDENAGVSSTKGSSDYSCASSVTEDEGVGIRAPVVAKLMGLDSLPAPSVIESYSTPFFQSQALKDDHYERKVSEYQNEYHQYLYSSNQASRVEGFYRKAIESRPQKLPSSPFERYCTETLPPKAVKYHTVIPHKLFSPIKSPGFIPPKNAADIIEAAARIIEPGYQSGAKNRYPSVGPSSNPVKVRDLKENAAARQRPFKLSEASRKPVESNAAKHLKGQSMNKSWNGPEDTNFRAYPDSEDSHSIGSRSKGKSVSLAIQAKVNVQKREGLSSGGKTSSIGKEDDEHKTSQPLKRQQNIAKNRQGKPVTSPASSVLKQNNQKQNCASAKEKLLPKPSVSNQHSRRVMPGETSNGRSKTFNKSSGNSKIGYKNGGLEEAGLEKEAPPLRMKNLPRKKRAIEVNFHSERSGSVDTGLLDRGEKPVRPRAVINEHLNLLEDSRKRGMDVVSFTFTSPMVKPMPGSQSTNQTAGKGNMANACYVDSHGEKNTTDGKPKRVSSLGLNVIGGDSLSILLEQKLRELTSEFESSSSSSVDTGKDSTTSTSILQDLVSALNSMSFDKSSSPALQKEKFSGGSNSGCSSVNDQVLRVNQNLQGVERIMECISSSDARKELDCHHPSPVSILEASFSIESCNSSDSGDVNNGGKLNSFTSIQAQNFNGGNCPKVAPSFEAAELSDSATSRFMAAADGETQPSIGATDHMGAEKQEMDYVKEILSNARLTFQDLTQGDANDIINPCLFSRLESKKFGFLRSEGQDESSKVSRKELFDCVSECVDSKCSRYVCGGYKAWAKGAAMLRKEGMAEEIYKEILGWRSMGEWMVDELVDKDMSSYSGRWLDFEAESSELGVEIERWILRSLIHEVVSDLL